MFECIRSFLVLHFVLSLYRQLITKSLIHYITQRYLTQSPKVFLQWNKVWLMSLCLKAGYYAMTSPSRLLFNGKSVVNDTVHFIASAASPSRLLSAGNLRKCTGKLLAEQWPGQCLHPMCQHLRSEGVLLPEKDHPVIGRYRRGNQLCQRDTAPDVSVAEMHLR